MDAWSTIDARATRRCAVRRWAALEGKSATMSEDLYCSRRRRVDFQREALRVTLCSAEIAAWMIHVWRLFRSG